jgi:hypothetical protein
LSAAPVLAFSLQPSAFLNTAPGAVMHFRAMLIFPRMKRNDFIASSKPSKRLGETVHFDHWRQRQKEILFVNFGALSRLTNSFGFRFSKFSIGHFSFSIFHFPSFLASQLCFSSSTFEVGSSMFDVQRFSRPSSLVPRLWSSAICPWTFARRYSPAKSLIRVTPNHAL